MSQVVDAFVQSVRPFEEDFIMVAEFSEQEGPKPLFTIPRDGGGVFDKNTFAVRVMAVDYGSVSGAFQVAADTQVVLTEGYDSSSKVYAFVYHFTLYDIQARGYVRPFCMVYLSVDEMKIMLHFEELLQEFRKVSDMLKHGNWPIFEVDLLHRKADLEHTRDELKAGKEVAETESHMLLNGRKDIDQVLMTLEEVKEMLTIVGEYVGQNSELDAQVRLFEELLQAQKPLHRQVSLSNLPSAGRQAIGDKGEDLEDPPQRRRSNTSPAIGTEVLNSEQTTYRPNLLDFGQGRRFDQKLRSLVGLGGTSAKLALTHLRRILRHFGRDNEAVVMEGDEFESLEPWSALLTIGRRIVMNFLHGIDRCCAQCEWPLGGWKVEGYSIPDYYRCQSAVTVSSWDERSFKSCMEDLSSIEADATTPPLFSMEATFFDPNEDSGSGGSSHAVGTDDMYSIPGSSNSSGILSAQQPSQPAVASTPNDRLIGWLQNTKMHTAQHPDVQSSTHGQTSADVEGNFTALSQLRPDPAASAPMSASSSTQGTAVGLVINVEGNQQAQLSWHDADNGDASNEGLEASAASLAKAVSSLESSDADPPKERTLRPPVMHISSVAEVPSSRDDSPSSGTTLKQPLVQHDRKSITSSLSIDSSQLPTHAHMHRNLPLSLRSGKDGGALPPVMSSAYGVGKSGLLQPILPQISSACDDLCQELADKPGSGLLRFRDRYVCAGHLVYALLRGRPVVVLGKSESAVRAMVLTLSVFVPGHSVHHQIVPWFTKPLNITHLARLKLVGLKRGPRIVIPRAVRAYVSIFDCDAGTLTTPPYKGSFVNSIVRRQSKWKDDRSYLAHVHSVFLEMASKAYLYFHNFCLNSPGTTRSEANGEERASFPRERSQSRASKTGFLARIGVTDCDVFIIEYLVEVVKMQQMADFQRANDIGAEEYPPTIRLDHSHCGVYQAGGRPSRFGVL